VKPDQTPGANQDAGGIPVYPEVAAPDARLREVLEQARLVVQWHGSMNSGPPEELDAELGQLATALTKYHAALAAHPAPAPDPEPSVIGLLESLQRGAAPAPAKRRYEVNGGMFKDQIEAERAAPAPDLDIPDYNGSEEGVDRL